MALHGFLSLEYLYNLYWFDGSWEIGGWLFFIFLTVLYLEFYTERALQLFY